ncbi:MAG: hypothetical protein IPJ19_06315 [Planctomycetes bacterium]|nr:hypothetical protein [Planctomycetota bacterium]
MSNQPQELAGETGRAAPASSIAWSAWQVAWASARTRAAVAIALGALTLEAATRGLLPIAVASSRTTSIALMGETRLLAMTGLALVVLTRAARLSHVFRIAGAAERASIVALSTVVLHLVYILLVTPLEWLVLREPPALRIQVLADSAWLASLAGLVSLARLEPRSLLLGFALLAWWVPVLGLPPHALALGASKGISSGAWTAEGILPMLVPHFLALGYVCLERAQR